MLDVRCTKYQGTDSPERPEELEGQRADNPEGLEGQRADNPEGLEGRGDKDSKVSKDYY